MTAGAAGSSRSAGRRGPDRRRSPGRRAADLVRATPPIPSWCGPALSLTSVVTAGSRGYDFLAGQATGAQLDYVRIFGVEAWGNLFVGIAVMVLVGLIGYLTAHLRLPLLVAHALAIPIYGAFIVALTQGLLDGVGNLRSVATAFAGVMVHVVMVASMATRLAAGR